MDWGQATNIGKSLLLSPIVGFTMAALLLLLSKALLKNKKLYEAPEGTEPPPFWIRALLVLTCTGVSFAHGSNDGQKGMGLIMLILIGTVPTAYALNHAVTAKQSQDFIAVSQQTAATLSHYVSSDAVIADPRDDVTEYIRTKNFTPNTMLALRELVTDIGNEMALFKQLSDVPADRVRNFRNDMYIVSEALRLMKKSGQPQDLRGGRRRPGELQEACGPGHPIHPGMGQSRSRDGVRSGYHGWLEEDRGHGGRKDRQGPFDLCSRRGRRDYRDVHNRSRRLVRHAGEHDARPFFGRGRNHVCESLRPAMGDRAQSR